MAIKKKLHNYYYYNSTQRTIGNIVSIASVLLRHSLDRC